MYTLNTVPHLGCKDCLFSEKSCKRIGGTTLDFARPWFSCERGATGFHYPCRDFQPKHPTWGSLKEWTTFDDFWNLYEQAWLTDVDRRWSIFIINGNKDTRYYVPHDLFMNGTMIENGVLKADRKGYFKRTKDGYTYIMEEIKGVKINDLS